MIEVNELIDYLVNGMYGVTQVDTEPVCGEPHIMIATLWFSNDEFVELAFDLEDGDFIIHDTNAELTAFNVRVSVENFLEGLSFEDYTPKDFTPLDNIIMGELETILHNSESLDDQFAAYAVDMLIRKCGAERAAELLDERLTERGL